MRHGSKLAIGWIAVIQLVFSLILLDALLLSNIWPGTIIAPWLTSTSAGLWFATIAVAYTAVVALVCWLVVLFVPTTTKTLTLVQDHSHRLSISKKGIEHSLTGMLASEYPQLANATAKVHVYRRRGDAKVKISATVVDPSDVKSLEEQVSADTERNLSDILGVSVRHVHIRLRPYQPGEEIEVA